MKLVLNTLKDVLIEYLNTEIISPKIREEIENSLFKSKFNLSSTTYFDVLLSLLLRFI